MPRPVGYPITISEYRQKLKDFGTSLKLDGTQGVISLGTDNVFDSDFYFSIWIKWEGDTGTYQHIFSKRDSYGADTMMFDLFLNTSTNLLSLDTNAAQRNFAYLLPKNKWVHLVWVHNVTEGYEQIYINADRIAEVSIATLGTGTDAEISVGASDSTPTEFFNGRFDEIVIGQSAPSWEDVVKMYANYIYPLQWTYLKLDEGSGSEALDSSGNGNDGIITDATYKTDKILTTRSSISNRFTLPQSSLKSLSFNGSSDYAVIPIAPSVTGFSFGIWINTSVLSGNRRIMSCCTATNTDGFDLNIATSNGAISFSMFNNTTNVFGSSTKLPEGRWIFITVTYKPNEGKFYLNAVQNGTTDTNCTMSTPGTFQLGKNLGFTSTCFKGRMSRFTFQNTETPWTQTQINKLFYQNVIPDGAVQWDLDNSNLDQNDENDLTLNGTSYVEDFYLLPRELV